MVSAPISIEPRSSSGYFSMICSSCRAARSVCWKEVPGCISRKPFAWPTSASGIISEPMKW